MRKILFTISVFLLLFAVSTANAQINRNTLRSSTGSAQAQTIKAENEQKLIDNLKQRANKEIDRRIAALNKLLTILGQMKRLNADQIASLKSQVQTDIDGLEALRDKIDADTDLTTLRTDVKSIVSDYRIFAFFMKYIHLQTALERTSNLLAKLQTVHDKLETKTNEASSSGKNVTEVNSELSKMQAELDEAKSLIDAANSELSGLTAQGYPGNMTTLTNARAKLKTIHQDLKDAHILSKKIINLLRSLNKTSGSPTVTATSTPTPTP